MSPRELRRRLLVAAAAMAGLGALLGVLVARNASFPALLDDAVRRWLLGYTTGSDLALQAGTVLRAVGGAGLCTALVVVSSGALAVVRRFREAAFLVLCGAGGVALNAVLKAMVDRPRGTDPRPLVFEPSLSFPSGHAMAAVYVYGAFAVVAWRLADGRTAARVLAVALGLLGLVVSFSRMWLGVHYLSDVVAGWLFAAAWVCVVASFTLARDPTPDAAGG